MKNTKPPAAPPQMAKFVPLKQLLAEVLPASAEGHVPDSEFGRSGKVGQATHPRSESEERLGEHSGGGCPWRLVGRRRTKTRLKV